MKRHAIHRLIAAVLAGGFFAAAATAQDLHVAYAYHAAEGLLPESVAAPGAGGAFLEVPSDGESPVAVYVLTEKDFAGPLKEQVGVRWWDGRMAHWVQGVWVKNVGAADVPAESPLAGALPEGAAFDLWRVDVPSWMPQPGDNYYAIQLKATGRGDPLERYLLARGGGDFSRTNGLGQVWSSSEEFDGQDWRVVIPGGGK